MDPPDGLRRQDRTTRRFGQLATAKSRFQPRVQNINDTQLSVFSFQPTIYLYCLLLPSFRFSSPLVLSYLTDTVLISPVSVRVGCRHRSETLHFSNSNTAAAQRAECARALSRARSVENVRCVPVRRAREWRERAKMEKKRALVSPKIYCTRPPSTGLHLDPHPPTHTHTHTFGQRVADLQAHR